MSAVHARSIRKSKSHSSMEAADLLTSLFALELVRPSKTLWLVSPWISDLPLLDNSSHAFSSLERWGARRVVLAEVLTTLATLGSTIVIGTTPDQHNNYLLDRLRSLARDLDVVGQLVIDVDDSNALHTKSVVGDDYVLLGSMNLTMNGVFLREEYVEIKTDVESVTQARLDAVERFGGVLQ